MIKTKEQEASAAKFESLMNHEAWPILERLANDKRDASMKNQDAIPAENVNTNKYCEERGFRKGIKWLLDEVKTKAAIG